MTHCYTIFFREEFGEHFCYTVHSEDYGKWIRCDIEPDSGISNIWKPDDNKRRPINTEEDEDESKDEDEEESED